MAKPKETFFLAVRISVTIIERDGLSEVKGAFDVLGLFTSMKKAKAMVDKDRIKNADKSFGYEIFVIEELNKELEI